MNNGVRKQSPEHIRKRIAAGMVTRKANPRPRRLRPCAVTDCASHSEARGLCNKHYLRLCHHGTTDKPVKVVNVGAYLARRSRPDGECRAWAGALKLGYGTATLDGRNRPAHVVAWEHANGRAVPDGLQINHRCHNRACINPDHLYAGTQKQNMADMHAAGRSGHLRGEASPVARLTEREVLEIRASTERPAVLCDRYLVSPSLIRAIRKRECWAHVP